MDSQVIYKFIIKIGEEEKQDLILAIIATLDIDALEQLDDAIEIYHEDLTVLETLKELISPLEFISDEDIKIEELMNRNWNADWESSFEPITVGEFCTIRASFHEIEPVGYDIIINPELAFGTGHHETTYMMIDQMSRIDFSNRTVFDYGCGTAVLAILAKKMGSSYTLGIDYDHQSIVCSQDCLSLNHTEDIELKTGTIDQVVDAPFDIVLANINRNVLLDTAEDVYRLTKTNGLLLLSGLLRQDEEMVTERYIDMGYRKRNVCYRQGWISMLMVTG